MMHTSIQSFREARTQVVRRINAQTFWTLLAIEGVLLTVVLAWFLAALTVHTPAAATQELPTLRAAISDRLTGATNDPLIQLASGTSAHESNLRGLSLNGVTYYYYVEGQTNFDPFSRGLVPESRIEKIFRDDSGPAPLMIYTIHP